MAPPQPLLGSLVISFDAAVDEQRNCGSITILACNHLNHACGWYCKRIPSIIDPLTLETLAGRESVILALTKGFNYVSFEGDCQALFCFLNGDIDPAPLKIQDLLNDVKTLSANSSSFSLKYINRCFNHVAHHLAFLSLRNEAFLLNPWKQTKVVINLLASFGQINESFSLKKKIFQGVKTSHCLLNARDIRNEVQVYKLEQ